MMTGHGISGGLPIGLACWISFATQDARFLEARRHDLQADRKAIVVLPAGTLPAGRLTNVIRKAGAIQSI